jgi:tetratricopeptide (TPR) repeat protein
VTSNDRRSSHVGSLAAILALGAAIVLLQDIRDRRFPARETTQQSLYLTSPAVITRMALTYDALMADLYWMRAIQYYGGTRLSRGSVKSYDLLYPLLDLTTSLDPHFSMAYRFGAFFLSERAPGGAGRPDLAVRLLEKAMAAHPRRWEYPYDVGFIYYRDGDYKAAAEWFQRAAEVPGAAQWLRPLAAVTLATGGDTQSSRFLWRTLLESEAEWLRQSAAFRLQQLDAIDQTAQLEQLTAEYARRFGDPPPSWEHVIRAGMLSGIPLDPAGHPYVLNPWWGDVTVSEESPMWPLPTEQPT